MNTLNPVWSLLDCAQSIIINPENWADCELAVDADGRTDSPFSPYAVKWGAWGAYYRVGGRDNDYGAELLERAAAEITGEYLADIHDHATIMRVFERAQEMAGVYRRAA